MSRQMLQNFPPRPEEPFDQTVLDCEYTLDMLTEPEYRLPIIPTMIREHFFYIQCYSHGGKGGNQHCTKRENLDSFLLALTLNGQGELHYNDSIYVLNPGDLFFIDCRKPHSYHTVSEHGWAYNPIHIQGAHMNDLYAIFEEFHKPVSHFDLNSSFVGKLERLWELTEEDSLYHAVEINQLITSLISSLIKSCHDEQYQKVPESIKNIQTYIRQHYSEPLTLDILSEHVHLNKYHISHEFKRYCGLSVVEYINSIRINEARMLLAESERSIAEVAEAVGFESLNYFYRVFQKYEKITPLQYRKKQLF